MGERFQIDDLPREQRGDLARLIALAFNEYPPFQHIYANLAGTTYQEALVRNFAYYIDLAWAVDDPVLGMWDGSRLMGGMLLHLPDAPDWTESQEQLTQEFSADVNPESFQRMLAFEAMMDDNTPPFKVAHHYVDIVATDPAYQGQGHGRAFIEKAIEMSRQHPDSGAVCLSTETPANHSFYERLGFEPVSNKTVGTITSTSFQRMTCLVG